MSNRIICWVVILYLVAIYMKLEAIEHKENISQRISEKELTLLFDKGVTCLKDKEYIQSIECFKKIIYKSPHSKLASISKFQIGNCYMQQKKYSVAVKEFKELLISYPNYEDIPKIYSCIANCFFKQNQYDQAIESFRQVISFSSSEEQIAGAHMLIAVCYENQKKYSQQIQELQLIINNYSNTRVISWAKGALELIRNPEYRNKLEKINKFPYKYEVDLLLFYPKLYLIYYTLKIPCLKISVFIISILFILLINHFRKLTGEQELTQQTRWNLKNSAGLYILTLIIGPLLILIYLMLLDNEFKLLSPNIGINLSTNFIISLIYIIVSISYITFKKFGLSSIGFTQIKTFKLLKWSSIGFLFLLIIGVLNNLFLSHKVIVDNIPYSIKVAKGMHSIKLFLLSLGILGILLPIGEEIIFRGIVYPAFKKRVGVLLSTIVVSVLFALYHIKFENFIILFTYAVIFTILYERTKSLYPSIITHSSFNILTLSFMYFR